MSAPPFVMASLLTFDPPAASPRTVVVHRDEWMRVAVVDLGPAQELPAHRCPSPVVLLALSGEARVRVGNSEVGLMPGIWLRLAPNAPFTIHVSDSCRVLVTTLLEPGAVSGV